MTIEELRLLLDTDHQMELKLLRAAKMLEEQRTMPTTRGKSSLPPSAEMLDRLIDRVRRL